MTTINLLRPLKMLLVLCGLTCNCLFAQRSEIFVFDKVECYYESKEEFPLIIYDKANGAPIDTLPYPGDDCWYKLAIAETTAGWLKIHSIIAAPGCGGSEIGLILFNDLKNKWVSCENMKIAIPDLIVDPPLGVKFYSKADTNSAVIFNALAFVETSLIEIEGTWAYVSFEWEGKKMNGWLKREDQCAYPWTSCIYQP